MKLSPVRPRILVVDDEDAIRHSLTMMFEFEGFDCETAASGPEAVQVVERAEIDLVILDVKMAGLDGLETLRLMRERAKDVPVIMLSGHGTVKTAVEATRLGAFDFLEKPPETEKLLVAARNALEKRRLVIENRRLRLETNGPSDLVGSSVAIKQVFARIPKAAPTNATVLIRGESGVVARNWWPARCIASPPAPTSACQETFCDIFCFQRFAGGDERPRADGAAEPGAARLCLA